MAIDPAAALCVPGTLTFNGVVLGMTKENELRLNAKTNYITAEETGNGPVEGFVGGSAPTFSCILRQFNATVLSSIMPALSLNVLSGTSQAGSSLASKSGSLIFTPSEPTNPGWVFYEACPMVEDVAIIRFSWEKDSFGIQCVFLALPDSSGRQFDWII